MSEPCQQAYTVTDGDTLSGIAARAYVEAVADINKEAVGEDPNQLEEGTWITVPAPGTMRVKVEKGDTLWDIVARYAWPHLYAANRDVVGPEPDLIFPGQILVAPPLVETAPERGDES